jgi:hypothetical protein
MNVSATFLVVNVIKDIDASIAKKEKELEALKTTFPKRLKEWEAATVKQKTKFFSDFRAAAKKILAELTEESLLKSTRYGRYCDLAERLPKVPDLPLKPDTTKERNALERQLVSIKNRKAFLVKSKVKHMRLSEVTYRLYTEG